MSRTFHFAELFLLFSSLKIPSPIPHISENEFERVPTHICLRLKAQVCSIIASDGCCVNKVQKKYRYMITDALKTIVLIVSLSE